MAKPRAAKKSAPVKKRSAVVKKKAAPVKKKSAVVKKKAAAVKKKKAVAKKPKGRRDPLELIKVGITPPELAPETDAFDLNTRLSVRDTRPTPEQLAELPWLAQDVAYRAGYYLLTHGLRQNADHPEIEICNVPGALLNAAHGVL